MVSIRSATAGTVGSKGIGCEMTVQAVAEVPVHDDRRLAVAEPSFTSIEEAVLHVIALRRTRVQCRKNFLR